MNVNLWTSADHARDYLRRADSITHRNEGESALLEFIPQTAHRILDLGTGDGRLLAFVKNEHPHTEAVALDFSPVMIEASQKRFAGDPSVAVVTHNLNDQLPVLGKFDAVISSFAIHHVVHERKRALYSEIYALLNAGSAIWSM
jgi:ubiquinone/menaquinone biosynthesis C-methylase UbiE